MMNLAIEKLKPMTATNGREYYSFWVRFLWPGGFFVSYGGWKYFINERSIGTPGCSKGGDKFIKLVETNSATYNEILRRVEEELVKFGLIEADATISAS